MSVWLDLSVPSGHFQSALVIGLLASRDCQMLKGCPPCSVLACGGGSRILNH